MVDTRKGTLFMVVVGWVAAMGWSCSASREEAWKPRKDANIVLISIDTLRADRLSLYGYEVPTSPYLQSLAEEAVVFDRFLHSGGGTLPSHMTMMTSLFPRTHWINNSNNRVLEEERITLAEQLKEAGYATAAFTDAGWVRGKFGFRQGFDTYDDKGGRFEETLPKAFSWLRENHRSPFFLFLHTYDVHSEWKTKLPYSCPGGMETSFLSESASDFTGCRGGKCATALLKHVNQKVTDGKGTAESILGGADLESISDLYDGCIKYVDGRIETIVNELKSLGVYRNTLLIITSDHGEEFGEHGMMLHSQGGYVEMSWIPLVIRFPDGEFAGHRVEHLVTMTDVMPTVLEAVGIPLNDQAQGVSALPAILKDRPIRRDTHMYSVLVYDRWKYFPDQRELYDLVEDPGEQNNVWAENPELVQELEKRVRGLKAEDVKLFDDFRASLTSPGEEVELTDSEIENLKALGYLQ